MCKVCVWLCPLLAWRRLQSCYKSAVPPCVQRRNFCWFVWRLEEKGGDLWIWRNRKRGSSLCVGDGYFLAPRGWRLHARAEITCAGAQCGVFMNQLFLFRFSPSLVSFFWTIKGGGREGGRESAAGHTSPWTPHLDVTCGVFIVPVHLHDDDAAHRGCGMKTGWRPRQRGVKDVADAHTCAHLCTHTGYLYSHLS